MITLKTEYYGTGKYWYFNNGQYAEKQEVRQRDCFELLRSSDNPEIIHGLICFQENDCGGQRLNSGLFPALTLTGKRLEAFNELIRLETLEQQAAQKPL